MPVPPTLARARSRQPLAGVALAAVGGIALAEAARVLQPGADDGRLGWIAVVAFLVAAALFLTAPAPWKFWTWIAVGYAGLHFFRADPLPAAVLAHALAVPAPSGHIAHAAGVVQDEPTVSAGHGPADAPRRRPTRRAGSAGIFCCG